MPNKATSTVGKITCGILATGAMFVLATSVAGAVNQRSFVQEIQSWGKQEKQIDDDKVTDQTPEDEGQTEAGDETTKATVANVDLENNIILLNK